MQDALTDIEDALAGHLAASPMQRKMTRPTPKHRAIPDDRGGLCEGLMAARPIWRGHLRLTLVSCPVALYNARGDRAGIRFNLINPETGNRIRMITQDSETGDELERRSLVKGYEFRKGKYLLLSDDNLDSVKVESSSAMTIETFVDTGSIDPVYFNSAYYLVPDGEAGKDVYGQERSAGPGIERLVIEVGSALSLQGCVVPAGDPSPKPSSPALSRDRFSPPFP